MSMRRRLPKNKKVSSMWKRTNKKRGALVTSLDAVVANAAATGFFTAQELATVYAVGDYYRERFFAGAVTVHTTAAEACRLWREGNAVAAEQARLYSCEIVDDVMRGVR